VTATSTSTPVHVGPVVIGGGAPLVVIAGPCVIESREAAMRHADALHTLARVHDVPLVYKSSFDKANRTSLGGFRGVGMDEGLRILDDIRSATGLPVLTDVHDASQIAAVAAVVDVLQTPAFLCRQTDFIVAVAAAGKPVNLKKGQFLSPVEMQRVVEKARSTGNDQLLVTERGFAFGYNNLVSDMRSLSLLAETGCPVVYDATHSVQQPGGQGTQSGGDRRFVAPLARAAVAAGCDAVFMEVHEDPDRALSDGATSVSLDDVPALWRQLLAIDRIRREGHA
jgi:2-dehydro-3-deoxyphosphooctonate aldolase (KDO 8-P synthase)